MQDLRFLNTRLAKAIGQLQLANQTLKTTRQEMCSLDQQIDMMAQEIEILHREVLRLREGYSQTLDHVPYPAFMADEDGRIEAWNAAAQRLFNLVPSRAANIDLSEIPVQPSLKKTICRKHRAAVEHGHPLVVKGQVVQVGRATHHMDLRFTSQGLVIFMRSPAGEGAVGLSAAS
jgi:PAS domain-containing protein